MSSSGIVLDADELLCEQLVPSSHAEASSGYIRATGALSTAPRNISNSTLQGSRRTWWSFFDLRVKMQP